MRSFCSWYPFPSTVHRCRAVGKANITIQVADIVVFHCYSSSSSPLLPLGLYRSSGHWSWIMTFAHLAFKFWEVYYFLLSIRLEFDPQPNLRRTHYTIISDAAASYTGVHIFIWSLGHNGIFGILC